ncbi:MULTISPECIES: WhiB family transcriptional regulator [unclassified Frankia]|uniref:WhiB family transcriptional regulator n=1 Tax=unclassified Frankia TaxID=2632575 RepID=UPI001EF68D3C|nr:MULTISPECIES: WhiB family transcriptional regulator [unclassified Frankia]
MSDSASARSPDGYVDWRHGAVCRGDDPELFFPVGRTGPAVERQIAMAKAVCGRCPVTRGCLDQAVNTGEDTGVWGGLDPDQRRSLVHSEARLPLQALMP